MAEPDDPVDQAMREGKFDNLSGKGKPLRLDEHPYEDPEWRLAHHILKESGFTLPWIQARQEIEAEMAAAQSALLQAWGYWHASQEARGDSSYAEVEWRQAVSSFTVQVERINALIRDYNLQTPSINFQMRLLNAEREIDRLKAI